ncbi:MAG: PH domain-containing protein [Planctomycetota bacterium]
MTSPQSFDSVVADATPAVEVRPVAAPKAAALLDGDELIQLSIKPSLWYIPLVSLNVVVAAFALALLLAFTMRTGITWTATLPFQVLGAAAALRLAIATLQWASRLYVLTNRRVLRFEGVWNVSVAECRLAQIGHVDLQVAWYSRWLRIGTIAMRSADDACQPCLWRDVARPQEIHEILVRAIRKAQSRE